MAEQPAVLSRLLGSCSEHEATVREIVPDPLAGVAFVARGSSDNAAVFGRYLAELHGAVPAGLVAPSLHTRYDARVDYSRHLVVAVSQSGETPEVVAVCERLRASGAATLAVTNTPGSALTAVAHRTLLTGAGAELAVPATKTVTAELFLMLVIARALEADPPGDRADLESLVRGVEEIVEDSGPPAVLARRWAQASRMLVAGRGLMLAATLETALKIKESAGILAEGMSTADLLHGPIAAVGSAVPVLVLDGGGKTRADAAQLVERLELSGSPLGRCLPGDDAELTLPVGLSEEAQVVLATVRGQQLALAMAREKGIDPDEPAGLAKVTRTH